MWPPLNLYGKRENYGLFDQSGLGQKLYTPLFHRFLRIMVLIYPFINRSDIYLDKPTFSVELLISLKFDNAKDVSFFGLIFRYLKK
ncbi:hypothetical protein SAMN06265348_10699 [Pedobacter westerhofensis]|uniref:Uncharacterized protein n=1 Tax=Pedobacter westerhofensis TaxID=425512 RepID=A0A521DQN0_9SPHI|nr:hypothetical protein ASF92_15950 [Pedobacter sp. Leaf176]SMO73938.1 hypothetical protein SAMN06265348_10699 [Pedobacter westerhofensis]